MRGRVGVWAAAKSGQRPVHRGGGTRRTKWLSPISPWALPDAPQIDLGPPRLAFHLGNKSGETTESPELAKGSRLGFFNRRLPWPSSPNPPHGEFDLSSQLTF